MTQDILVPPGRGKYIYFSVKSRTLMVILRPSPVLWLKMDSGKGRRPSFHGAAFAILNSHLLMEIKTTPCSLEQHHKM